MKTQYKYYINRGNGLIYRFTKDDVGTFLYKNSTKWYKADGEAYPEDFAKTQCRRITKKFVDKIMSTGFYDSDTAIK